MTRSRWSRLLAFIVLLPVAGAAPAVALSHAEAHHGALAAHQRAPESLSASPAGDGQSGDHDHPVLTGVPGVRVGVLWLTHDASASSVPAIPAQTPGRWISVVLDSRPYDNPKTGPPPRLRAPPLI